MNGFMQEAQAHSPGRRVIDIGRAATLALAAAVGIHQLLLRGLDPLVRRVPLLGDINVRPELSDTGWGLAPRFAVRAALTIFVGLVIGRLVGTSIRRRPAIVAAAAALAYGVISTFVLEGHRFLVPRPDGGFQGFVKNGAGWSGTMSIAFDLLGLVGIAIASIHASRIAKTVATDLRS